MSKLPDWSSVKYDPMLRLDYHKQGFDMSLKHMENLTREMLAEPSKFTSNAVSIIRMIADSMVKSFNQLYYDVAQGFPGYDAAVWPSSKQHTLQLTTDELTTIRNMVDFSTWHASDSMWPAFVLDPLFEYDYEKDYDWHWYKAYMQQMSNIIDARIKLGLDPLGDYGNKESLLYPNGSSNLYATDRMCPACGQCYTDTTMLQCPDCLVEMVDLNQ